MEKVSNEELVKISQFISSCNDMINGKFILADVKILKILNMIASSEELYRYIQECLIDFNFEKEYNRAEVKNRFNNGVFVPPQDRKHLVAMVFSLLVEFDKKHIDFYNFINTNFATLMPGDEYANFAKTLLVPFRDAIAFNFGLYEDSKENYEKIKAFEEKEAMVKEEEMQEEVVEEDSEDKLAQAMNNAVVEAEEKIWKDLPVLVDSMMNCVMTDRKIKGENKDNVNYILKTIKYASKYKDMRLISALLTSVDVLTVKATSIRFILKDLKNEILDYYNKLQNN
ncbi:MAG: hypothetical protein KBT30_01615 [Clostridiales bacterium]|nr:hypothetical protein [Candidatus Apopatousia equi]